MTLAAGAADDSAAAGLRVLAVAALVGAAAGLVAQFLRESREGAISSLGGGTALWVTIGFLLARRVARTWAGPDREAWAIVAAASYLLAWLAAYHALYGVHDHVPFDVVWTEARYWVAAVTPACVVIGLAAAWSHREGPLGDVCLALPLGWSLPEAYLGLEHGWSFAAAVTLPTLLAALTVFLVARDRRPNPVTIAGAAVAIGLVAHVLYPHTLVLG